MKSFKLSQKITAVLFIAVIALYFLANVVIQQNELFYGFVYITPPPATAGLNNVGRNVIAQVDDVFNRTALGRDYIIDFYSYIQLLLNKEENGYLDIIRAADGSLHYTDFYPGIPDTLEEYALRLVRLKEYANNYGCEVLFINSLPLHTTGYTQYSEGLPYKDDNPAMDAMLFYLQSYGIDYLDLREYFKESGFDPDKYRYKTDHHWTVEAGFEGFKAIVQELDNRYGENLDPDGFYTDLNNYIQIDYPESFIGTLGKRTGIFFVEPEDFTVILPNYPTSYSTEFDTGGGAVFLEGDFNETIFNPNYLSTYNMYLSYLNGLSIYRNIINHNNTTAPKILMIHDSLSLPLAAFMAPVLSEINMIYPLSNQLFGYSVDIDRHIEENISKYDYIIVELIPDNFNEEAFSFFK